MWGIKPKPWQWQPHKVHPQWRWATKNLVVMVPYWEGAGIPRVWQSNGWVTPTVGGSPSWYQTKVGVGFRSAASGDKVTIPVAGLPSAFPSNGEIYTMLAVFQYDDLKASDESGIVSDGGTTPRYLELISTGNVRTWPNQTLEGATALSAAGLHTAAAVRDGTNATVYLDGAIDAGPAAKTTAALGASDLNVSGGANQDWFDGTLLGVFIWGTALSHAQIVAVSRAPFGILTPIDMPVVAYIPSGSQNASVNSASASATGYSPTPSPQSVTHTVAVAVATAAGLAVGTAQAQGVVSAAATATGLDATPSPQPVTHTVDSASATATGLAVTPAPQAVTVSIAAATATAAGLAPTPDPQSVTHTVDSAAATATGLAITPVLATGVDVNSASASATGYALTASPQAIAVSVNSASATAVGLDATPDPQSVTVTAGLAEATATGFNSVATLGSLVAVGSATATATAYAPTPDPQSITMTVGLAEATAIAYGCSELGASSPPSSRIYVVDAENRVYLVPSESRVYTVEEESRVVKVK